MRTANELTYWSRNVEDDLVGISLPCRLQWFVNQMVMDSKVAERIKTVLVARTRCRKIYMRLSYTLAFCVNAINHALH